MSPQRRKLHWSWPLLLLLSQVANGAATFELRIADAAGVGFNDNTPVTLGIFTGNPGTTLGQARIYLFNEAFRLWGQVIDSNVTIVVSASWAPLTCNSSSGVLGSARPEYNFLGFGHGNPNAWYPSALADALAGSNIIDEQSTLNPKPGTIDIITQYNSAINGDSSCLNGSRFYLGFNHQTNAAYNINLLPVLLHELGHGLGFASFVDRNDGTGAPDATGEDRVGIFDHFIYDEVFGMYWPDLTASQRLTSRTRNGQLTFNGALVNTAAPGFLSSGLTNNRAKLYAPTTYVPGSSVSHWDTSATPNLLMEPSLTSSLRSDVDLASCAFYDLGWNGNRCPDAAPNSPPIADSQSVTVNEDTFVAITLTGSDPEGVTPTYRLVSSPTRGVLTGIAPNLSYRSNLNISGSDSFQFVVNDGVRDSAVATVNITINPVNDAPVGIAQAVATRVGTAVAITLAGTDIDSGTLSYTVIPGPTGGQLSGTPPNLIYTPNAGFSGSDFFTFRAFDGFLNSNPPARVDIEVADDAMPVAQPQSVNVEEDSSIEITPSATDAEGEALTYSISRNPTRGTVRASVSAGKWIYEPNANLNGPDSFEFTAADAYGASLPATVSITITPKNDAPVASAQSFLVRGGVAQPIELTGTDIDSGTLTFHIETQPTRGTLTGTPPMMLYTPQIGFAGTDRFTFKVNDGQVDSAPAEVTININPNRLPVLVTPRNYTLIEDATVNFTIAATDPDGNPLTYAFNYTGPNGQIVGTAPNFLYRPNANYWGTDVLHYGVSDGIESVSGVVNFTITPVNDAPVANAQTVATRESVAVAIVLTASDIDSGTLSYALVSNPVGGVLSGTAPNLTYTPNALFSGTDAFTFSASDGSLPSIPATVTINVAPNRVPVASPQSVTVLEDGSVSISLQATDADADALTYRISRNPTRGIVRAGAAGNIWIYEPNSNFNGADSFEFVARDALADSLPATVSITITPVNDAPVANAQTVATRESVAVPITLSASDIEPGALNYTLVTNPVSGLLSGTAPNLTYTPNTGFSGSDTFTFRVSDGLLSSSPATVTINVAPNRVPVASPQSVTVLEDGSVSIALQATDADGDALTYRISRNPDRGNVRAGAAANIFIYEPGSNLSGADSFDFTARDTLNESLPATVSISIEPVNDAPVANTQTVATRESTAVAIELTASDIDSGTLSYTVASSPANGVLSGTLPNLTYSPNTDFSGTDTLSFRASDGLLSSSPATVTINVEVNSVPVADAQLTTVPEDGSRSITLQATDADGDALTYRISRQPGRGILGASAAGNIWTYEPNSNINGTDSFEFVARDALDDSLPATVSINITAVNDAPVANAQVVATRESTAVAIELTASDIDSGALSYTLDSFPADGVLSGAPPNLTYTPDAGFSGTNTFSFHASDGLRSSNSATVTVNVAPNRAPVASPQSVPVQEDGSVSITLQATDADGDALTYRISRNPTRGTVRAGATGNIWIYEPSSNLNGPDSFQFVARDALADSLPATVSITVTPVNDVPVAAPQSVSVLEDGSVPITLQATDADLEPLTYRISRNPARGTVRPGAAGNIWIYEPGSNLSGPDSFEFTASDALIDSPPATVSISITPVNDAPVANAQTVATRESTAVVIALTASDDDSGTLSYALISNPANGVLTGTAPYLTYTPNTGFTGTDSFTFSASDASLTSIPAIVTINVAPNGVPVALPQSATVLEDGSVSITLQATDADADALTYRISGNPTHGTVRPGAAANIWIYEPNSNFNGADSFQFVARDALADSLPATVSITITPVNDAPVANAQTVATRESTAVAIVLSASDVESAPLTYSVVSNPVGGVLSGTAPNLTYTPNALFSGTDTFTFRASDGSAASSPATVTINVAPNRVPVASAQSVTVPEDGSRSITLQATDADGDALTYRISRQPGRGILRAGAAGNIWIYEPNSDLHGPDSFEFTARDALIESLPATVSISVTPVNDAPVASTQVVATRQSTAVEIELTASDIDSGTLNYTVVVSPANGLLTGTAPNLTYTPNALFSGTDSFTFRARDGALDSSPAAVTINVVANSVPVASPQSVTVLEDGSASITLQASDSDGDALTYRISRNPARGTVRAGAAANIWIYEPSLDLDGADSFQFVARDALGDSLPATVSISITPVNDAPVTNAQSVTVLEDGSISISLQATDADADALTYRISRSPARGTVSAGAAANIWAYQPNAELSGADSFEFVARDAQGDSPPATVSITITPVNDAPVATAQTVATRESTAVNIALGASDIDSGALSYSLVANPANGLLSGTAPNITYTPNPGFSGSDSFTFRASDGLLSSTPATVTINVAPNRVPVALPQSSVTVLEDGSVSITLQATDGDGDALTYRISRQPARGTLNASAAANTWIYSPNAQLSGNDSFEFTARDALAESLPATVSIAITPVNDVSVVISQSFSGQEDQALNFNLQSSDADGQTPTFRITRQPTRGQLTLVLPNSFSYVPPAHFNGAETFEVVANDGIADSAAATITLNITPVNDAPAAQNQQLTVTTGTAISITLAASDVEGDTLSYRVVSQPSRGTLTGSGTSYSYTGSSEGADTITFVANDGRVDSNLGTINLTVNTPPPPPPASGGGGGGAIGHGALFALLCLLFAARRRQR